MRGLMLRIAVAMIAVPIVTCITSLDRKMASGTVLADDNANPATDDGKKPVAEAPLSPKWNSPVTPTHVSNDGTPCTTIDVLLNGEHTMVFILGEWEKTMSFRLRTDGKNETSAQLFERLPGRLLFVDDNAFASAVILCPDEECLKAWEEWFPKACKEAWDAAHPVYRPGRIFPDGPHESK